MSTDDPESHYQKLPFKYKPEPLNVQQVNFTVPLTLLFRSILPRKPLITTIPWPEFLSSRHCHIFTSADAA
jgi:hypothetical protein